jgi:arginine decarboxylase
MPIHRLNSKPEVRAGLVDLTCDSDGKLNNFVDRSTGQIVETIPLHEFSEEGEDYYLGVFLVGAYQEILGDLHNLFGDTDAVHVTLSEAGYTVDHVVEGDSVSEVLSYLEYNRSELLENIRKSCEEAILNQNISKQEAKLLLRHYELGLAGYTYLEDPEV